MNLDKYQSEAGRTKSDSFHAEKVLRSAFITRIAAVIETAKKVDELKKALYYDREYAAVKLVDRDCELSCSVLPLTNIASSYPGAVDILHAALGKVTESVELLEAVFNAMMHNTALDITNVIEEAGDGFWYDAILFNALGVDFEHVASINNAKLRRRFPVKFSEAEANTRNLDAERQTLENGRKSPYDGFGKQLA